MFWRWTVVILCIVLLIGGVWYAESVIEPPTETKALESPTLEIEGVIKGWGEVFHPPGTVVVFEDGRIKRFSNISPKPLNIGQYAKIKYNSNNDRILDVQYPRYNNVYSINSSVGIGR